jgi:hypothetical protein
MRGGQCFPLHVQDRTNRRNCEVDAKVKGAASGANTDGGKLEAGGMYSHTSDAE